MIITVALLNGRWELLAEGSVTEVTDNLPATVSTGEMKPRCSVQCTEGLYSCSLFIDALLWIQFDNERNDVSYVFHLHHFRTVCLCHPLADRNASASVFIVGIGQ